MKRAALLTLVAAMAAGGTVVTAPLAAATKLNGCYMATAILQTTTADSPANERYASTVKVAGPSAGTEDCRDLTYDGYVPQQQLRSTADGWLVGAVLDAVDESDNATCTAAVANGQGQVLQQIPMAYHRSGSDGTSIIGPVYGYLPPNDATLNAVEADDAFIDLACTYGDPAVSGAWHLPLPMHVVPQPAGEFPGVSINNGAASTRSRSVHLALSWDGIADKLALSNDGGFAAGSTTVQALKSNSVPWTLPSDGDERLPKTVYVRFHSPQGGWSANYTDDIILDTTAPTLTAQIATASADTTTMTIHAQDDRTGVRSMQISVGRVDATVPTRAYASKVKVFASAGHVYARVRDGAGNWSKWRDTVSPRLTSLTATFADSTVERGEPAKLSGRLSRTSTGGALAGRTVRVQKLIDGQWKTITKLTTNERGRYAYTFTAKTGLTLRIVFDGTSTLSSSRSASKTLRVAR